MMKKQTKPFAPSLRIGPLALVFSMIGGILAVLISAPQHFLAYILLLPMATWARTLIYIKLFSMFGSY